MRVPFLIIDENGQQAKMAESHSICDYLDLKYPQKPLYPRELLQRQRVMEICCLINSAIQPLQNIGVQRVLKQDFGLEKPNDFSAKFVKRGLSLLESLINDSG